MQLSVIEIPQTIQGFAIRVTNVETGRSELKMLPASKVSALDGLEKKARNELYNTYKEQFTQVTRAINGEWSATRQVEKVVETKTGKSMVVYRAPAKDSAASLERRAAALVAKARKIREAAKVTEVETTKV